MSTASKASIGKQSTQNKAPDSSSQVKHVLAILSRHHDVVSRALGGSVHPGDSGTDTAIESLTAINVLMPYDDSAYHLNPNLRNFLLDHLNQFSAFESLSRISGTLAKIRSQWNEIGYLQNQGEEKDAERVELAIDFSMTELIHMNERNLMILNAQISTDYGNVESLKAKLRQNLFYGDQVKDMAKEMLGVKDLLKLISEQSRGEIQGRVRAMVLSRMSYRSSTWDTSLNDIAAIISKKRFAAKLLDPNILNLAKTALWMTRNPTLNGFDYDPPDDMDPLLVPLEKIQIRPQIDVLDHSPSVEAEIRSIASKLPALEDPFESKTTEAQDHLVFATKMPVIEAKLEPIDQIVMELIRAIREPDAEPISLVQWQASKRIEHDIDCESWLLYAATQISMQKIAISYKSESRRSGVQNDVFSDVIALPKTRKML